MRILMVVTSWDRLGHTDKRTGLWLEELAAPYHEFKSQGFQIDLASPLGGNAPVDPRSLTSLSALVTTYIRDRELRTKMRNTLSLAAVDNAGTEYDACFVVGGHGAMWDLPDNTVLQRILVSTFEKGHVVAAVCHGPAALVNCMMSDGDFLVKGRRVNSFTNEEERALGLEDVVPFLLETRLRELGANFEKAPPKEACVVQDGNLVTGQNPASAAPLARKVAEMLAVHA
jgi:putative intracellular protease/amidase